MSRWTSSVETSAGGGPAPGAGWGGDVRDLRAGEPPVHRHHDGPEPGDREHRLEELGAVVEEQPDDVAAADAQAGEPGRRPRDPPGELRGRDGRAGPDQDT